MNLKNSFPPELERLVYFLSTLPGVGPKSARRIAFHILNIKKEDALGFADAIRDFVLKTRPCSRCGFPTTGTSCLFCDNPKRNNELICVVEKAQDILNIENTHIYHGHYHVLGGLISPIDGIEIGDLRLKELIFRIEKENFREALLALSPNMEGEVTSLYLGEKLKEKGLKTFRLSLGLPMGADLEFTDSLTLSRAISSSVEF